MSLRSVLVPSLLGLVALSGPACRDRNRVNSRLLVQVSPREARVAAGGRLVLQASRLGQSDPTLVWELQAGSNGLLLPGGVFLAPQQPGISRITVRDPRSGERGEAVIHVEPDTGEAGGSETAEQYDPATATRSFTGRLRHPRLGPGLCRLQDGSILVHGGTGEESLPPERYDPKTRCFKPCLAYGEPRTSPMLTLLPDGRVLVLGGSMTNVVEVYDPKEDRFLSVGTWPNPVLEAQTLLLPSNQLLILENGLQILDVDRWTFTRFEAPELEGLHHASLSMLPDGRVLIAGGWRGEAGPNAQLESRIFLLTADLRKLEPAGTLKVPRARHLAHVLPGGRVLLFGGQLPVAPPAGPAPPEVVEEWDPRTLQTTADRVLDQPFRLAPYVMLADGRALAVGAPAAMPPSAEITQIVPLGGLVRPLAALGQERTQHGLSLLKDQSLLVVGGGTGPRSRRTPGARP